MGVTSEEQEEEEEVENENKHRSANKPNVKEACSMMWDVELYRKKIFFKLTMRGIIFRFILVILRDFFVKVLFGLLMFLTLTKL